MDYSSVDNLRITPGAALVKGQSAATCVGTHDGDSVPHTEGAPFYAGAGIKSPRGGGVVSPPLLDHYATSARCVKDGFALHNAWQSRRIRRFYQRYFTGVGVGGSLRFLTLTSSDQAVALDYDIHRHFRALVMRLRRRWGRFEYMGVVEHKGGRKHLHLVFRGEYMAQAQISAIWRKLHASPIVDIRAMYKVRGGARELAKYLAEQALNRYWASYNWVFRGWVSWSKRVRRAVGRYPSKALLGVLSRLDKFKRGEALEWLGWRWGLALDNATGVVYNA